MTFAVEKLKRSSARWYLVRLNPSRHVTSLLGAEGGGIYSMTMPYAISSVTRNGVTLTETTTAPVTNDFWYHNETTGEIEIKLAAAPSTTTNVIVIKYYIFMTSSEGQQTYETPTDSATPFRVWEPRIEAAPVIQQGIPNIIYGVFTIESISLEIVNTDLDFQKYMTENDSFKDSPAMIWLCIGSEDVIKLVYTGKCQAPTVGNRSVSISIFDTVAKLDQPAYFGDTADECFFYKTAASFPNMNPLSHGTVCPLIIGQFSRYRLKPGFPLGFVFGSSILDSEHMHEAVCINYDQTIAVNTNRSWGLCRVMHDGSANQSFRNVKWGACFAASNSGNVSIFSFTPAVWATMDVQLGDAARMVQAVILSGIVERIDDNFTFFDVIVRTDATVTPAFTAAVILSDRLDLSVIIVSPEGVEYRPLQFRDYAYNYFTTSGGNRFIELYFYNNFESRGYLPGIGTLDPNAHKVFYKIGLNTADIPLHKHGTVMKRMAENSGIEVLSSTFTQANTDLNVGVLTSIPDFQETEYGSYLKLAEELCYSSLGFVFSNEDGKAEYHLLKNPVPTETRTDDYVLDKSVSFEVNYQDIFTRVIAQNVNDKTDPNGIGNSFTSSENIVSRYLYDINRPKQLFHILDAISGRIAAHLSVVSNPVYLYQFSTSTIDSETSINDDITLVSDTVSGGTADVKVIGVSREIEKTKITAIKYGSV